jgi:ATP-dependent Clp protease ATP-binding subunit ClpA
MSSKRETDTRSRTLDLAAEEARRRGDSRIETEHLLLAILHDEDSVAPRVLGTDLRQARAALQQLDAEALHAVGVEIDTLPPPVPRLSSRRPPLSSGARAALHRAVLRVRERDGRAAGTADLVFGLLTSRRPDAAAQLATTSGACRRFRVTPCRPMAIQMR